ncbi:MAG: PrsW family intramembrane metalloprotease [Epulopiscium sp.]|nr:PrsW family intramembrane metalloprotease [Candidatus Epulonipiscium sp.]
MYKLIQMALAPIIIIIFYIYIRDKYEKEPIRLLILGLLFGSFITIPILGVETILGFLAPSENTLLESFYIAFIVAAFTEECFKYIILYFLIWRNHNFNEKFDGIVYAVFISLGFASVENIIYVLNPQWGGVNTAAARAILSVPGHALFGVAMGYYFSMARFEREQKDKWIAKAFYIPILLHGIYDFILMANKPFLMIFFIPFVLYLWVSGFRKMKKHLQDSPFRPRIEE